MKTSTVSSKYQIVIPKELRRKFNIQPGQKLRLAENVQGELVIDVKSAASEVFGSMKGAWGSNSDAYLRELRDEADCDRTR